MSFRRFGGINYAAKNNIVKNNFTNANNLSIMTRVGQPNSSIDIESTIDAYAINLTSSTITTYDNGVVPKSYVDAVGSGLKPRAPCECGTTTILPGNVNPATELYSNLVIDDYTVVTDDRVLIKNQEDTNPNSYDGSVYNGIYIYTIADGLGTFKRSSDFMTGDDAYGTYVLVQYGVTNSSKSFIEIKKGLVGYDPLLFIQFSSSLGVGQGLEKVTTDSATTYQVKSNLSSPAFITSMAVSGLSTCGQLTVNGASSLKNTVITGNLSVSGTSSLKTTGITGNLSVSGTSSLKTTGITGNLSVSGTSSLSILNASGLITANNGLTANGATSLKNTTITGNLSVSGICSLSTTGITGNLSVSGTSNLSILNASGLITANNGLTANGLITANNGLTANGSNFIAGYAVLASPAFTGTPTAPTASAGTNTSQIATTAYVDSASLLAKNNTWTGTNTFNNTASVNTSVSIPNPSFSIKDTGSNRSIQFAPQLDTSSYNYITQAGDTVIYAEGSTAGSNTLVLTTHSNVNSGVRITGTSSYIGAGGTSTTGSSSISFSGTEAQITGSLNMTDTTLTNRIIKNVDYQLQGLTTGTFDGQIYIDGTALYIINKVQSGITYIYTKDSNGDSAFRFSISSTQVTSKTPFYMLGTTHLDRIINNVYYQFMDKSLLTTFVAQIYANAGILIFDNDVNGGSYSFSVNNTDGAQKTPLAFNAVGATISTGNGSTHTSSLSIIDTVTSNTIAFIPNCGDYSYNPASNAGNQLIYAAGTKNTEILQLSSHSDTNNYVKIRPTSVGMGAGGTSTTAMSSVECNGASVLITPSLTFPNNTVQTSAYTGWGSALSYTNANLTFDATGKIIAISSGAASSSQIYGSGVDGILTFDGAAVSGFSYALFIYTMTRDVYASIITMIGGFTIKPGKYRLFCSGTFTSSNSANFISAEGQKGGIGTLGGAIGGAGGLAGQNGGANGGAGGSVNNTVVASPGSNTTNSFNSSYGGGGAGGQNVYTPGAGGVTVVSPILLLTNFWNSYLNIYTMFDRNGNYYSGGAGGGGGGGGFGGGAYSGGGGGGGGGAMAIFVYKFILNSTLNITANGGAGGDGPGGGAGGGGGGGFVLLCTSSSTTANLVVTANGGTKGVVGIGYVNAVNGNVGIVSAFYNLS